MGGLRGLRRLGRLGGLGGLREVRQVGQVGQVRRVGVVCFSVLGAVIRCLYFGDCSSHTRLCQLADFCPLFLYPSYI